MIPENVTTWCLVACTNSWSPSKTEQTDLEQQRQNLFMGSKKDLKTRAFQSRLVSNIWVFCPSVEDRNSKRPLSYSFSHVLSINSPACWHINSLDIYHQHTSASWYCFQTLCVLSHQSTNNIEKSVCRQSKHVHVRAINLNHSQHTPTLFDLLARLLGLRQISTSLLE